MKTIAVFILLVFSVGLSGAQNSNNAPKISWDVNKEVDENGNIIRYDSTYSWSYTNTNNDSISIKLDNVMRSFNRYFDQQFPSMWHNSFMMPFRNDSLLQNDFLRDDYFHNRWEHDFFNLEELFLQMDSIRNQFFKETYPGLKESNEEYKF